MLVSTGPAVGKVIFFPPSIEHYKYPQLALACEFLPCFISYTMATFEHEPLPDSIDFNLGWCYFIH